MTMIRAAFYARVSGEQQAAAHTIGGITFDLQRTGFASWRQPLGQS
jgi:hypothetical protein